MKRCPTCNQTFEEDWLSFCTQDGTSLIDDQRVSSEPLPTGASAPSVQPVDPNDQATWNLQSRVQFESKPIEPMWQPPPPPKYAPPQSKGLATASMIVGIASMICLGPVPGIVAIILGAMALSQMKKTPEAVGGKQQAVTGIVTGSLGLFIYGAIFIFYILVVVLAGMNH